MVKCEHCGKEFPRVNHLKRHAPACLGNPAVVAALRQAIDDGTGRGMQRNRYKRSAGAFISDCHLSRQFGGWSGVCEFLGLLPPYLELGRQGGLNAPLTDAERHCCQRRAQAERMWYPSK